MEVQMKCCKCNQIWTALWTLGTSTVLAPIHYLQNTQEGYACEGSKMPLVLTETKTVWR